MLYLLVSNEIHSCKNLVRQVSSQEQLAQRCASLALTICSYQLWYYVVPLYWLYVTACSVHYAVSIVCVCVCVCVRVRVRVRVRVHVCVCVCVCALTWYSTSLSNLTPGWYVIHHFLYIEGYSQVQVYNATHPYLMLTVLGWADGSYIQRSYTSFHEEHLPRGFVVDTCILCACTVSVYHPTHMHMQSCSAKSSVASLCRW